MTSRIGVRCAANPTILWFHVDTPLLFDPDMVSALYKENGRVRAETITRDAEDIESNFRSEGLSVSNRLLGLLPERTHVTISDSCVSVAAYRHQLDWETVLPQVVNAIRRSLNSPDARVEHQPPKDNSITEWHLPLLRELFGVEV